QIFLIVYDISFFLLRIYAVAPFSALYCEGPLCQGSIPKQILLTILAFGVIANLPCFLTVLVRVHQAVTREIHSAWRLSDGMCSINICKHILFNFCRKLFAIFSFFGSAIGVNVLGFGFFGGDSEDAQTLVQQPELQWLARRGGTLFVFGDFGKPQHFRYEMMLMGGTLLFVGGPVVFFFHHSLHTL
ncbi:hypothetical protein PFISCL1PPCAC_3389, partial [Pristionchus fissidentatus]